MAKLDFNPNVPDLATRQALQRARQLLEPSIIDLDASKLVGRGSLNGSGNAEPITLGVNLTMVGTTLSAMGGMGGLGDVMGPASSTNNAIARFDGVTGKLIKNSNATISDAGLATFVGPPTAGGAAANATLAINPATGVVGRELLWGGVAGTKKFGVTTDGDASFGSSLTIGDISASLALVLMQVASGIMTMSWDGLTLDIFNNVGVSGNISVTGTVDGRNVSEDEFHIPFFSMAMPLAIT